MIPLTPFIFALFFLFGSSLLTTFMSSLRRVQKWNAKKEFEEVGNRFFYRPFQAIFIKNHEFEGIFFAALSTLNFCRFLLATFITYLFFRNSEWIESHISLAVFEALVVLIGCFILSDFLPRIMGNRYPHQVIHYMAPIISFYLILFFPFNYLFIKISRSLFRSVTFDYLHEPMGNAKQEIFDIIQESDLEDKLEPEDKKMIESVVSFQDLIAREVMVPRVDLFALQANTPIKDAAKKLQEEGYSRIPVFRHTIDEIVGVLMYKDILTKYMEAEEKKELKLLDEPIETIVKPVLYAPETKKISHLLQEFKKKQMHLAIIVDEYGGTEGIVTFEDILEEIVGDIEDEYDNEEDEFIRLSDGSYIVDPRMSIIDLEELLGVSFPEEGDYDTLGGYIFHLAGEIPSRGYKIKHNKFDIEVLRANDRFIEKVKIKVIKN